MSVLDNKCPGCGAKIPFNPKSQLWECSYCAGKFTLEDLKKHDNASSEKNNLKSTKKIKKLDPMIGYHCKNCGALIMADENVTATSCLYCGSTAILKDRIDDGRAPDYIIPFKKEKQDALNAFTNLTKGKILMPKTFNQLKNIDKINGIYIPFWAYDFNCCGDIDFSSKDIRTWSDSNYNYTETSRYSVTVNGEFNYENVLADASSRFNDELMDSLEPFDYKDLVEYNHAFLSGFFAEKYDVEANQTVSRAKNRTMDTCVSMMEEKIRHQTNFVKNNNLQLKEKTIDYIMLPVWMINVNYKNKIYTFAMNAQTGKIVGNIPIGVKETITFSLVLFTILFFICSIVFYIGG